MANKVTSASFVFVVSLIAKGNLSCALSTHDDMYIHMCPPSTFKWSSFQEQSAKEGNTGHKSLKFYDPLEVK